MSNPLTFLGLALLSLTVGLIGHGSSIVNGMGKALFGVFLIMFLIVRLFGEENA